MDEILVAMMNGIGAGPTGTTDALLLSPLEYNEPLYTAVVAIHSTAVKPVTSMVLSILATLMLASNASKIEGDRELGVKIVFGTMFKIALVFLAAQSAILILDAIAEVGIAISQAAANTDVATPAAATMLGDQLRPKIEATGAAMQLGCMTLLLLPYLVSQFGAALLIILIFVRFLQLYMLTAFASLPIAFFGHDDTKQMGIGYLKRYASTILTGVMLILATKLYQAAVSGFTSNVFTADAAPFHLFVAANLPAFFVPGGVLIWVLFSANSVAKMILGEG